MPGDPHILHTGIIRDSHPLLSKLLESHAWAPGRVACGVASMRGYRNHMEDGLCALHPLSDSTKEHFRFCGVFDGHAQSKSVAVALQALLPYHISQAAVGSWLQKPSIERACINADKDILRSECSEAGSTAIFCIFEAPSHHSGGSVEQVIVTVGSVGDSQAMMIFSDYSKPPAVILEDQLHRPGSMNGESERVRKSGGFVSHGRVDGELAVSRAFGDAKFKRDISRKLSDQKVIALPSVQENLRMNAGDILLLACDGLFDALTPVEIGSFIRANLLATRIRQRNSRATESPLWLVSEALNEVAGKLIDHALIHGSKDNITVMLLQFVPAVSSELHVRTKWSDKSSRVYIPPILFPDISTTFAAMLRDELKTIGLDYDLILSQCERSDKRHDSHSLNNILPALFNRQWENRDSWIQLGMYETPNARLKKAKGGPSRLFRRTSKDETMARQPTRMAKWISNLFRFKCFSAPNLTTEEIKPDHRHLSSSFGGFGNISSLHASNAGQSMMYNTFSLSAAQSASDFELQSRQTSAQEDAADTPES